MTDDNCGSTDTTDGTPCRFTPGESCPYHDTEDPPDMGRDPKLTKEREEQIAQNIENGKSITSACRMAGISKPTFYNWMDRGKDEEETVYSDFFNRIMRARGHGEDFFVDTIIEVAKQEKDLATLMSILKQRYPESWGDVKRGEQASGVIVNLGEADEFEIDPETLEATETQ